MFLGAGQGEGRGIAALAARAAPEEPRSVAERGDDQVGPASQRDGRREALGVGVSGVGLGETGGRDDLAAGKLRRQRLAQRGQFDAWRGAGRTAADVHRERVAAEYGRRRFGVRSDHGDAGRGVGRERQGAVVRQQDHRLLGDLARQVAVERAVQVDGRPGPVGSDSREGGRSRVPVLVEQTQLGLLDEHSTGRAVHEGFRYGPVGEGLAQGVAERLHGGQFDIDARRERGARGLAERTGPCMKGLEERDAEVVSDDGPFEPPGVTE